VQYEDQLGKGMTSRKNGHSIAEKILEFSAQVL